MMQQLSAAVVPAFLLLCLLAGGSSQGIWSNAALQLIAALMLGYVAVRGVTQPLSRASRLLVVLAVAALVVIVLQLVPLPPSIWTALPGRYLIASAYASIGYPLPWLPLSWTPYATLETAYALLPPLAVAAWMLVFRGQRESWIAGAIVAGALGSVLLGAVQVASGGHASWAYLYPYTNSGAVGFFANRNHMAVLLVMAIPFAAALFTAGEERVRGRGKSFALLGIGAGGFVLLLVGLLLNASLAALALAVPVIAFSALILPAGWRVRRLLIPAAAAALVAGVIGLASSSIRTDLAGTANLGSFHSRHAMWTITGEAIADTFPVGTGLGSFARVFALYEKPAAVDATYVNHAHNDYLELVLELGLPGILLIVAGLSWWAWQSVRTWRSPLASKFAKAATIASAAVLAHSIVDYPLRSAGLAVVFAACLASLPQAARHRETTQARHVTIA